MDLVLFGIQGSGKGTQAKRLAAEFGFDIFEAGGELRKIAASGSELGNTVKSYIDQGHLVPHEIIMQVVKEAIAARPKATKILFDGIPRDTDQMRDFDAIMKDAGRDFRCTEILLDKEQALQNKVVIATIQSLSYNQNYLKFFSQFDFDLLISDEAKQATLNFQRLLAQSERHEAQLAAAAAARNAASEAPAAAPGAKKILPALMAAPTFPTAPPPIRSNGSTAGA
jgi:adenylate kinase family enzyme